jgi:hypothetical protein
MRFVLMVISEWVGYAKFVLFLARVVSIGKVIANAHHASRNTI